MNRFDAVRRILAQATAARTFPAAAVEVGHAAGAIWQDAVGRLTYDANASPARLDTIFDLASLTKVIATTSLAIRHVEQATLALTDRVADRIPDWRGADRALATLADLLEHASGLTTHLALFRDHAGRADFQAGICGRPLEYPPRTASIYSDLGFILLGFVLEDAAQEALAIQFDRLAGDLGLGDLRFLPPQTWRQRTAPTQHSAWRGRLLVGEVHDENAWALGGTAGHTGLFGSVQAVGRFARLVLRTLTGDDCGLAHPATLARFVRRSTVRGTSRARGWDTMLTTSSCGHRLSASAIGHTGFTGTSLWIDPTRDLYVVLLTNRVHPSAVGDAIQTLRPAVHDAIVDAVSSAS